ncbi:MAG TPA: PHP domain-containing protein [Clostridiaceae bacterium]|nr:PHP domain-containing protein [Clostridiaceae bacterium]
MRAAIDLHIHSALSPCADNSMTPNNIVNMAHLKGLDVIAVTDHNSAENAQAVLKCAKKAGMVAVAGMEIETMEEIHVVCLFPGIEEAMHVQRIVYDSLPPLKNRVDIFGEQLIMNENDEIIGDVDRLLLTATNLSVEDIFRIMKEVDGVALPAHADREAYGIIARLGGIPDYLDIKYLEISSTCNQSQFERQTRINGKYSLVRSSDAHSLGSILERESFLEMDEVSVKGLLDVLRGR